MLRITISKSGEPPTTTSFDKREITIGRTTSNDVRIPEPGVSSSHARILYTDGTLTLVDLSSTNGTFVNGSRIQGPHMVQPGDEVYVCSHRLEFDLGQAGARQADGPPPAFGANPGAAPPLAPPPVAAPPPIAGPAPSLDAPPPPVSSAAAPVAPPSSVAPPPAAPPIAPAPASIPPPPTGARPNLSPVDPLPERKNAGMPTLPPMLGGNDLEAPAPPVPAPAPAPPPSVPAPSASVPPPPSPLPVVTPDPPAAPPPASAAAPPPIVDPTPPAGAGDAKEGAITPSTAAPSAKGELDSNDDPPNTEAPAEPKVVLGSRAPVRTGATMMPDPDPPAEPKTPAAWSMPRVGTPPAPSPSVAHPVRAGGASPATVNPAALAGLQREAQTREACRQVFGSVRDMWLTDPSLDDDALIARLRTGIEDLRGVVGHLEPMSLSARMQSELCGVGPLQELLRDRAVQEILLEGPTRAAVTKHGQTALSPETTFSSDVALEWVVSRLTGCSFGPTQPIVETTTADGHRVHAIHPSLAVGGPIVRIRRNAAIQHRYDLAQLTSSAALSDVVANLLASAVSHGLRIAVFAGPGAPAFPLASALALAAPPGGRHVIVRPETEAALLPDGAVVLQSSRSDAMPKLVDAALGLAPTRLLIHGIAGAEAGPALEALGRGFDGVVLTSRASTAEQGVHHLAALSGLKTQTAAAETRSLRVAGSLDLIVVLNRFADGITRVTQVCAPGVSSSGAVTVTDLITFDPHSGSWTHASALQHFIAEFAQRGVHLSINNR